VRDGVIKDETFLPLIFSAPPDADWKDEAVWARANPNLGVSVNLEFLRSECARAVEMPAYESAFRQLYLNQWVEVETRWLRMDHWAQGNGACPVDLAGRECWAGLDLATTFDTTALVLLFPLDDGTFWVEPHFWIPSDNAHQRERRDKVPYLTWHRQGHLHMTDGNVTDFDQLRRDINNICTKYRVRGIGLDPWNAAQLGQQLQGDGLPMQHFRQGYASMSAPSKQLENWVVSGKLLHGGHPVLGWQAANVAIQSDSAAGNIKPSKAKSTERIDGIVSLVMAIGLWQTATAPTPEQTWDLTVI
jgi:phage terminase large subunit-like protein